MSSSTLEKERAIYLRVQHDPQHENGEDLNYEAPRMISSFPLSQEWATSKKNLALSSLALVLTWSYLNLLFSCFFSVSSSCSTAFVFPFSPTPLLLV